jgi:hypothetical protein
MPEVLDRWNRTYVFYWAVLRCLSTRPIWYLGLCNLHLLYHTKLPVLESDLVKAELHFHSKTPFFTPPVYLHLDTFCCSLGNFAHFKQRQWFRRVSSHFIKECVVPSTGVSWNVCMRSIPVNTVNTFSETLYINVHFFFCWLFYDVNSIKLPSFEQ